MSKKKIREIPVFVELKVQKDGLPKIRLYADSKGKHKLSEPIDVVRRER